MYEIRDFEDDGNSTAIVSEALAWIGVAKNGTITSGFTWLSSCPQTRLGKPRMFETIKQLTRIYDSVPSHNSVFIKIFMNLLDEWAPGDKIDLIISDRSGSSPAKFSPLLAIGDDRSAWSVDLCAMATTDTAFVLFIQAQHSGPELKLDFFFDVFAETTAFVTLTAIDISFSLQSIDQNWAWVQTFYSTTDIIHYSSSLVTSRNLYYGSCDGSCLHTCFEQFSSTNCFHCGATYGNDGNGCVDCSLQANSDFCSVTSTVGLHPEGAGFASDRSSLCDNWTGNTCDFCNNGSYLISNGCAKCDDACETCFSASNNCNTCIEGYYLDVFECLKCDSSCIACSSAPTHCTSCKNGYHLESNNCVPDCPSVCGVCSTPNVCISCKTGYHLAINNCVPDCPSVCGVCSTPNVCISCKTGYHLVVNNCIIDTVINCPSVCKSCSASNICTSCQEEYKLDNGICHIETELITGTQALSTAAGQITAVSLAIISAISAGSPGGVSVAGLAKMLEYIKYINVSYSEELEQFLRTPESEFLGLKLIPDLPERTRNQINYYPLPEVFLEYNVPSSFLVNFWENLFMISIFGGINAFLFGIDKIQIKTNNRHKILQRLTVISQNLLVTQLYNAFGEVIFFAVLEFRSTKKIVGYNVLNFIIETFFLCVWLATTILHILFLRKQQRIKNQKNSEGLKRFYQKYEGIKVIFEGFKDESWTQQGFLLFFTIRDITFSLILTTLFEHPLNQAILITTVNCMMLGYLFIIRPFKELFEEIQQIFCEAILLGINVSILILAFLDTFESTNMNVRDNLGTFILMTSLGFNFAMIAFLLVKLGLMIREFYQTRKNFKRRELPSQASAFDHSQDISNNIYSSHNSNKLRKALSQISQQRRLESTQGIKENHLSEINNSEIDPQENLDTSQTHNRVSRVQSGLNRDNNQVSKSNQNTRRKNRLSLKTYTQNIRNSNVMDMPSNNIPRISINNYVHYESSLTRKNPRYLNQQHAESNGTPSFINSITMSKEQHYKEGNSDRYPQSQSSEIVYQPDYDRYPLPRVRIQQNLSQAEYYYNLNRRMRIESSLLPSRRNQTSKFTPKDQIGFGDQSSSPDQQHDSFSINNKSSAQLLDLSLGDIQQQSLQQKMRYPSANKSKTKLKQ